MRIVGFAAFALLAVCSAVPAAGRPGAIDLGGAWRMKDFTRGIGVARQVYLPGRMPSNTLPIRVPGTVRAALLEAGEIPDPYFGYDNEKSLWVEEKEWWFFRTFDVPADLEGRWIDLSFGGTSFRGEVYLNGKLVGQLEGMLNPRSFDVTSALRYGGENAIAVRLEAPSDVRRNEVSHDLTWYTSRDQLYSIAQCMYGWDWGPHGVPIGIWQPVALRVSGPLRVGRPYVRSRIVSTKQAVLSIALDVTNLADAPRSAALAGTIVEKDTGRRAAKFERTESLAPGETRTITLEVPVKDPRLWWPNGMGAQDLYLLDARVSEGAALSESVRVQFGIRELELVANENVDAFVKSMKEHTGSVYHLGNAVGSYPWTFEVNGRKMFAKGGNWIPVDQLLRLDRDRYDRLLRLARDAHFNLLRVWGGGLYETDDFYELCDEYGLLAWQEFLSNRSFSKIDRASFLDGANSAVLRLRNHPSLTFWCGGNEFDPDDAGSKAVIDALAELLARLDPQREFHRASPYMGDDHYWGVWHLKEPYTAYRVVRPFRSEAGVNTFPVLEDYLKFTPEELRWPADPTWIEFHGEYNTRFHHLTKLRRYADEFGAPTSIADFITKSQLYQALADSFNLEFCRANKFSNSGLLVWQYDDIWPAISWSMVDWYGTPKPSYYFFKRAARPVHVSADYEKYLWKAGETFAADIHLLNDTPAPVRGDTWRARILDVRGTPLAEASGPAAVEADRSAKVGRIELPLAPEMAGRSVLVLVELMDSKGAKVSDAAYPIAVSASGDLDSYENIFSELSAMPAVALDVQAVPAARRDAAGAAEATLRLTNPAAALAYFVRVRLVEESATLRSWYGDNYVSLAPGETKNVEVAVEAHAPGTVPATLTFEVSGWNAPPRTVAVAISR